jgi:hypothetical protein
MARESDQEVRDRQEKARTDAIRERQIRLGHVPAPVEEEAPKPKPKSRAKK